MVLYIGGLPPNKIIIWWGQCPSAPPPSAACEKAHGWRLGTKYYAEWRLGSEMRFVGHGTDRVECTEKWWMLKGITLETLSDNGLGHTLDCWDNLPECILSHDPSDFLSRLVVSCSTLYHHSWKPPQKEMCKQDWTKLKSPQLYSYFSTVALSSFDIHKVCFYICGVLMCYLKGYTFSLGYWKCPHWK